LTSTIRGESAARQPGCDQAQPMGYRNHLSHTAQCFKTHERCTDKGLGGAWQLGRVALMAVIAVCIALVVVGVVMVVRWGGELHKAPMEQSRGARGAAARALRYVGLCLAAGLAAGVLAAGAGGRLVMRLLAATSPEAEGGITDAGEIVGRITVDGTLGFFVFVGLPAGFLSGALYALVGPVLPPGRLRCGSRCTAARPCRHQARPAACRQPRLRSRRPRMAGGHRLHSAWPVSGHARGGPRRAVVQALVACSRHRAKTTGDYWEPHRPWRHRARGVAGLLGRGGRHPGVALLHSARLERPVPQRRVQCVATPGCLAAEG
jgi:hypothetical protein